MPNSTSVNDARNEDVIILDRMPCIYYLVPFWKRSKKGTRTLINLDSEINAITPVCAKHIGLRTKYMNVRALKIDDLSLKTLQIVIANFQVIDKLGRV